MTELCELDIENTNINSGLEYLPESIKCFYCTKTPLLKNYPELKKYEAIDEEGIISYNYLDWKKENNLEAKVELPTSNS
jgi:hypothetical protein